jgi:hypothetical protein
MEESKIRAKFLCYLHSSVFQGFHYTREAVSGIECRALTAECHFPVIQF